MVYFSSGAGMRHLSMLCILYTVNVVQFCPLKEKQVEVPAEKLGDTAKGPI